MGLAPRLTWFFYSVQRNKTKKINQPYDETEVGGELQKRVAHLDLALLFKVKITAVLSPYFAEMLFITFIL